ncbi:hypothetical protein D9M71_358530 [compost metagenome]
MLDVGAVGRSQAEGTEQQHRPDQYDFSPKAVSQWPGAQCTKDHADQSRAHHRAEAGAIDSPILRQSRRNEPHGRGIEAIEKDNQETQDDYTPLVARNGLSIDEGLHVKAVSYSRLGLVHYFYSVDHSRKGASGG